MELLTDKREQVEMLALALLDREVLHQQDVEDLLGKRPFEEKKIFEENPEVKTEEPTVAEVLTVIDAVEGEQKSPEVPVS
jgi:cell division protease FtsH